MSDNKIKGLEDFEDDIHDKLINNGYKMTKINKEDAEFELSIN